MSFHLIILFGLFIYSFESHSFKSLFGSSPSSPVRSFYYYLYPLCHISEYQFAYYPNKNKDYVSNFFNLDKEYILNGTPIEFYDIQKQYIKLLRPTNKFGFHPRTIYFAPIKEVVKHDAIFNKEYIIDNITITDKKKMISYRGYSNFGPCGRKPLDNNGLINVLGYKDTNLIWRLIRGRERHELLMSLTRYQRFNHFPICWNIHNKSELYMKYHIFSIIYPNDFNYMPETYTFPLNSEQKEFIKNYKYDVNNLWIIKPGLQSGGTGITMLYPNINYTKILETNENGVISKYISNPYLINGLKFDLRIYVLVTGFSPLKVYLYQDGLVRFAGEKYSLSSDNLKNNYIHLTNYAINKNSKDYKMNDTPDKEEGNKWTIKTLKKHIEKEGKNFNELWDKIKDIVTKIFITYQGKANNIINKYQITNSNLFELFGIDILIDDKLKPWLMEVNINPSLNTDSKLDLVIKTDLMTDLFNIIGIVPYHHTKDKESLDHSPSFNNITQENIYEALCEFERPSGKFDRIFPRYSNIDYYKQFFNDNSVDDEGLWKIMKDIKYD